MNLFMKKHFLTATLIYGCLFQSTSQMVSSIVTDSLRLESAMKTVRSLKDSAKVDMLNSIARRTTYILSHQTRIAIAYKYANEALQEATRLNYKPGIAAALLTLSATNFYASLNMPGDIATKEKYAQQARQLAEETKNYELLGWCYYLLAGVPQVAKSNNDTLITYWKKSVDNFLKAKATLHAADVTNELGSVFAGIGQYETAFDYAKMGLDLSQKSGEDFAISWKQFNVQYALANLKELYVVSGDYETAMNYIRENARYGSENKTGWEDFDADIAGLYCTMGKYDSATVYASRLPMHPPPGLYPRRAAVFGQIYLNGTKEYNKAIEAFTTVNDTVIKYISDTIYATAPNLISIAQAYDGKKEYNTALRYANQGVRLVEEKNRRPLMMQGYQVLSTIYHHLGNNDSAYEYLIKHNSIKDSIQNKQFLLRIYNSKKEAEDAKKEARIGLLNRDNEIKRQQLKQEATFRNFLIAVFVAAVFAGLYVYRNTRLKRRNEKLQQQQKEQEWKMKQFESDKKQAELQKQAAELEMQALRAQMNPHFIFNCLSSINRFILKNESKEASNYLTRFSRLIRMVLLNSQKPLIALEEELEMLRLYLDMERLRSKNSFDYVISSKNEIDAETFLIPPLLLQPICENAIWHGLNYKEVQGHLSIDLSMENNMLKCEIADNGIGREKAAELKSKSAEKYRLPDRQGKSMGLQITTQRLALINQNNNVQTFYRIEDVLNENKTTVGTKVILKISHKGLREELV